MDWTSGAGIGVAVLPVLIWLYLLCARGGFWRVKPHLAPPISKSRSPKKVAVVIPARNEADVIAGTIASLLVQDFEGACEIFVVDDASRDATADEAMAAAGNGNS